MIDELLKKTGIPEDVLSFCLGIVAILIFLLFIYFVTRGGEKSSSYIGFHSKDPMSPNKNNKLYNQTNYSNHLDKEEVDNSNKELGHTTAPNETDTLIKLLNEKRNQIQQTKNDDETIRTEINFDIFGDDLKEESLVPKYEYLQTANNGSFRKLLPSDEKCFFRTWEENEIRKFEFYGNVEKALANLNAIFDDVCEIEGKQNGATNISNIEPGILDSQLKIEKKAKIKLT